MLKQKINLGRSFEIKNAVEFLPFEKFIFLQLYFLIALLFLYIFSVLDVVNVYVKYYSYPGLTQALTAKYERLKMIFPDLSQSGDIQKSISLMKKEIDEKRKKLSSIISPYQWSFSEALAFVSASSNDGMWINELYLDFPANNSRVNGYALALENINRFSKALNADVMNRKNMVNIQSIDKLNADNGKVVYQFGIQLVGNA